MQLFFMLLSISMIRPLTNAIGLLVTVLFPQTCVRTSLKLQQRSAKWRFKSILEAIKLLNKQETNPTLDGSKVGKIKKRHFLEFSRLFQ